MSEWKEITLGDFMTLQRGFDLPESSRIAGSSPIIASTGIVGTHNKAMVKGPGVVIGRSGSIGGGQFIQSDFWPLNTTLWVKDFKGNDPRFCYYLLKSIDLTRFNAGSGVPTLNRNHIHPLPINVPTSITEQKAIAHILGSLDDKIELNRRMNETLEAMARAIFKDWFVDFGPTRAKIAGRAPYLPEPIWSLFPDAIDPQSGLPIGWEIAPFESIVSVKDGTHDSPKMSDFGYPLITSKHLKNGYIDFDSAYLISEKDFLEVNKRSKVDRLDILITMIGTVGNLFFVDYKSIDFAIKNVGLFKTSEKPHLAEYLYLYLGSSNITNYLASRQSGTTQSYLTLKTLRTIPVVLPKVELVEAFKTKISSIFERIAVNRDESRTLAELRDRLLPKLMSGQIRVKDAEKLVEEVL